VSEAAHPSSGSRAATSSTSSELELIEQLKQQLAGPLFAAVSDQFSNLQNSVVSYQNKLQYAETEDPCAGVTTAAGPHREVWARQRKTLGCTTGVAGTGTGSQQCGSAGGERASGGPALDEDEAPASGTAGTASKSFACRAEIPSARLSSRGSSRSR